MDDLLAKEAALTSQDKQAIRDAILHAYPDFGFLYLRLADKWGFRVDDYIDVRVGRFKIVADLLAIVEGEGRVLDLLAVTWTDKSQNPKLKALADRLLPDHAAALGKYAPPPPASLPASSSPKTTGLDRPSLEKLVEKRSRLLNLARFEDGIERLAGALCRISAPSIKGTGFLVGRHTVLTNYHVMQEAIEGKLDGARILCEFDYRGVGPAAFSLTAATGLTWDREHRTYSQSDLTGTGDPAPDELDFALVTLAADVSANRLQLAWPNAPPIVSQRDFIVIGQHPQGDVANIAFGEVLSYPSSGLRYRYDVTTEAGSSGSPVLTLDQQLVALHHAGDPAFNPSYNQGVPIWLIMSALKSAGIDLTAL